MAREAPGGRSRVLPRVLTAASLVLLAAAIPSAGFAVGDARDDQYRTADFDLRSGKIAPSAAQRAMVRRLHANATWSSFGTPSTLIRHRGHLGRVNGTATAAARRWLAAHRGLFRLDSAAELGRGQVAALGRNGRAVTFRQRAGSSPLLDGGLVTVALRRAKAGSWNVVFVSSSLAGRLQIAGSRRIDAKDAWRRAARSVGHTVSGVDSLRTAANGWTFMRADGLSGLQSVRAGLLPSPHAGLIPAYETVVYDELAGDLQSYRLIVDARTGRVLLRQSTVDHAVDNPRWKVFPGHSAGRV